MTFGPRTWISAVPPSRSASRSDTPGSGKPTVPGRRSPSYGLETSMIVSVMPYRSSTT